MSAAVRGLAIAGSAEPIRLDAHRLRRRRGRRDGLKIAAICAIGLLALFGGFADSAIARTSLLLVGSSEEAGNLDGIATTLIWTTIANVAVLTGVILVGCALLSRPSADIVALDSRRKL